MSTSTSMQKVAWVRDRIFRIVEGRDIDPACRRDALLAYGILMGLAGGCLTAPQVYWSDDPATIALAWTRYELTGSYTLSVRTFGDLTAQVILERPFRPHENLPPATWELGTSPPDWLAKVAGLFREGPGQVDVPTSGWRDRPPML